jgi:hypothetical protein
MHSIISWRNMTDPDIHDIICRNRLYECLGCAKIFLEREAEEHQIKCDSPMRLFK